MSYRISIEFPSQRDFHLVRLLLDRLGVPYWREEPAGKTQTHWLDGLGLAKEPAPMSYEVHLASGWEPGESPIKPEQKPPYGAWEAEEESLEELLNMLTA